MAEEIHAVVNPVSGAGKTRRRWPELARRLEAAGIKVQSHWTARPGEATAIASELLRGGAREILSVGGDGTANEVANGFFADGAPFASEAVLSVIPTGTGHDFARSLGIRDVPQSLGLVGRGRVVAIDVGFVEYLALDGPRTRCFVNAADVGLGAVAAAIINRSPKTLGGVPTYLLGAVRAVLSFSGGEARVTVDGEPLASGPIKMVLIANGRFHAGGMRMAPMARMDDGRFEVLVLGSLSRLSILGSLLPRVYRGAHLGHPGVRHASGRVVEVRGAARLPFEVDGEQPGTADLRAWLRPRALRVRVPDSAAV